MKAVLLVCFFALANANVFLPPNENLLKLEELLKNIVVKRDVSHLANNINEELMTVMDKVKESVEGADTITKNLKASLKAAEAGLANGKDVKELGQMVLSTLVKDVSTMMTKGTYDLDLDKMFKDIVPNAVAKLTSKHSRRFLLDGLVSSLANGLKDTIGDAFGLLTGTGFGDLKGFLGEIAGTATDFLHPTVSNLKNLATAFLSQAGTATASVAMEAVKFFEPFKQQLGSVFTQIQSVAQHLAG